MRGLLSVRTRRAVIRGPLAATASQAVGLLQIGLLLLRGGATDETDTYFYLFTAGLTPVHILVVGVMYPLLLNAQPISQRGLARIRVAAPITAAAFVAGGCLWIARARQLDEHLLTIAVILAVNAILQGCLYFRAVAAEAGGDALWTAGIALPANACACAALLWPWEDSSAATTAMVVGLVVGNAVLLVVVTRRRIGQAVLDRAPTVTARHRGSLWFFAKSAVGYLSTTVLASLAVLLPASGVTVLALANRVVGALVTTLINAVMPVFVHQSTEGPEATRRLLRGLTVGLGAVGTVVVAGVGAAAAPQVTNTVVVVLWVVASAAAAVSQRMAYRFLPPRAAGNTMPAVVVIVVLTAVAAGLPGFDVTTLLCAYAAIDAATAALLLWYLRDRVMCVVMSCVLVVLSAVTLVGLA